MIGNVHSNTDGRDEAIFKGFKHIFLLFPLKKHYIARRVSKPVKLPDFKASYKKIMTVNIFS